MKTTLLFVAVLSGLVIPAATTRTVYFSAVDAKGQFVNDLTAADVVVEEDGQARDVIALEPATESCHVAIVVDDGGEGLMQTPVIELLNAAAGRALFSISSAQSTIDSAERLHERRRQGFFSKNRPSASCSEAACSRTSSYWLTPCHGRPRICRSGGCLDRSS